MIPKKIYFFWDGKPMPWLRYITLQSFKKFNPYWDIELWCPILFKDKRIVNLDIPIKRWKLPKQFKYMNLGPAQQSDIFQWYKLYETGGYYSDLDIIYIKSIFKLYSKSKDKHIMFNFKKYLKVAFMGFEQNSESLKNVIDILIESYKKYPNNYQNMGNTAFYLNVGLTRYHHIQFLNKFILKYPSIDIYNFKGHYLFQVAYNKSYLLFNEKYKDMKLRGLAIGIHWFGGTDAGRKYEQLLTAKNYQDYDCYLCNKIKELNL